MFILRDSSRSKIRLPHLSRLYVRLEVSGSHHVFLADGVSIAANQIQKSDCLSTLSNNGECVMALDVAKVRESVGWRAPLTASGTILVNGILASTYAVRFTYVILNFESSYEHEFL